MPISQRIAHMPPEGALGLNDPLEEVLLAPALEA
jgi:hypothetical protein